MKKYLNCFLPLLVILLGITGCQSPVSGPKLTPVTYADLPGWEDDTIMEALPAMRKSCKVLRKKSPSTPMITKPDYSGTAADWQDFCAQLEQQDFINHNDLKTFLESSLRPHLISSESGSEGIFTGYYEPILHGSRTKHGAYQIPLYKLPGRSINYKIPRSKIIKGALKDKKLEIVWVNDPIAAFFMQIQGSGRVRLEDGKEIRLGYAGQNGYPYFPIGKELLKRGVLQPGNVNMHSIRQWLKNNPHQAEEIMSKNQSYVFF